MIILSSVYRGLVNGGERFIPATVKRIIKWDHPAGPKTIHFWAPMMKWVSLTRFILHLYLTVPLDLIDFRAWWLPEQRIWQDPLRNFPRTRQFLCLRLAAFGPATQWSSHQRTTLCFW